MKLKVGDKVKVIGQTIAGEVVRFDGQKIVILDDEPGQDLEEGDEPTLAFRPDELERDEDAEMAAAAWREVEAALEHIERHKF